MENIIQIENNGDAAEQEQTNSDRIENNDDTAVQEQTNSEPTAKSKRTNAVWQYYEIDSKKKEWRCKLCKNPRTFINLLKYKFNFNVNLSVKIWSCQNPLWICLGVI
jgi:hypothetical protein